MAAASVTRCLDVPLRSDLGACGRGQRTAGQDGPPCQLSARAIGAEATAVGLLTDCLAVVWSGKMLMVARCKEGADCLILAGTTLLCLLVASYFTVDRPD